MDTSILSKEDDPPLEDAQFCKMLKDAIKLARNESLEASLVQLDAILEIGSLNLTLLATAYMWYGRICQSMGQPEKALSYFQNEVQVYRFTTNTKAACDSVRRIMKVYINIGKQTKAKRAALELIQFAENANDLETGIEGRVMLANMFLNDAEKCSNKKDCENLLNEAKEQIIEAQQLDIGQPSNLDILEIKAKYEALNENRSGAIELFEKYLEILFENENWAKIHFCYFQMSRLCYPEDICLSAIDNLRSAIFFAKKCSDEIAETIYTIKIANILNCRQKFRESFYYGLEALGMSRNLANGDIRVLDSMMVMADSLIGLKKYEKAGYFLVYGSVLALLMKKDKKLMNFYQKIDKIMSRKSEEMNETKKEADNNIVVELLIDGSDDPKMAENSEIVIKLEHTTTIDTWKMTIADIVEARNKKKTETIIETKTESEPIDFFDMIAKMNVRMDDQRTELPTISVFAKPRPLSAQSKKKGKSHRLLPGFRANISKLNEMKIDMTSLQRMLKRKTKSKSKLSVNSDSQTFDIPEDSEIDTETLCSNSDLASCDSASLNKENIEVQGRNL